MKTDKRRSNDARRVKKEEEKKRNQKRDEEELLHLALDKLGKKALSIKEMAALVSYVETQNADKAGNSYKTGAINRTRETIRERLEHIYDDSDKLLTDTLFKVSGKSRGAYRFAPEYSTLLLLLLASGYYSYDIGDTMRAKDILQSQLLANIQEYILPNDDTYRIITNHPAYETALYKNALTQSIHKDTARIVYLIQEADLEIGNKYSRQLRDQLEAIRKNLAEEVNRKRVSDYQRSMPYGINAVQKNLDSARTLKELLIALIAVKVHGIKKDQGDNQPSLELNPIMYFRSQGLSDDLIRQAIRNQGILETIKKFNDDDEAQRRYRDIMYGIAAVLNLTDPLEQEMFRKIDDIVQIQYIRSCVDQDFYYSLAEFIIKQSISDLKG